MNGRIKSKPMKEILYRESRVAKALGEPAKYAIVHMLLKRGPVLVNDIVKEIKRSQPTVSHHLAQLRNLEIVRYEAKSDGNYYWIKYPEELRAIVIALDHFVRRTIQRVDVEE